VRKNVNSVWTEALTADLIRLWDHGYSCSQIGAIIGVTRNAVIGKAHRLELPSRSGNVNALQRAVNPHPPGTPRKPPRMPRRQREFSPPKIITAVSNITGAFINFKRPPLKRELTKNELRAMLTLAVQNTAAMEVLQ